ncbi:MAG: DUF134 domain-containing protein [Clostridiales bacterium]|nr:DUF134 domain-containing protein [Clostridiales bacterium]
MPRPTKCRMICRFPQTLEFIPVRSEDESEPVILTVDEFETVRLIDKEGLSQEECSKRMQVARTTAQKIYNSARLKIATALVEGLPLKIEGGEYQLCDGWNRSCGSANCRKQKLYQIYQKSKGETIMRIAVTYENGQIFQHFGRTEQFKIYDTEDGKIVSSEVVSTNGEGHCALAEILRALQADVLICGGIGGGAQAALNSLGIKLYGGVSGDADAAAQALLEGTLAYVPDVRCSHHEEHHHGEGCGEHHHGEGCGGHGGHHHGEGCGGHHYGEGCGNHAE